MVYILDELDAVSRQELREWKAQHIISDEGISHVGNSEENMHVKFCNCRMCCTRRKRWGNPKMITNMKRANHHKVKR